MIQAVSNRKSGYFYFVKNFSLLNAFKINFTEILCQYINLLWANIRNNLTLLRSVNIVNKV
jgi:hypothetical protein